MWTAISSSIRLPKSCGKRRSAGLAPILQPCRRRAASTEPAAPGGRMNLAVSLRIAAAVLASEFPAAVRLLPGSPRVELTNTGTQAITAWSFAVSTPNASGGVQRETHTADVYLSEVTGTLPGAEPHLDRIMPGQSRALPIDAAGPDARVQIIALVLPGGTAL